MTSLARRVAAYAIGYLPGNALRVIGLRLLGYQIAPGTRIGFGTVIAVTSACIERARIGRRNRFIGPMELVIGAGTEIVKDNEFRCPEWAVELPTSEQPPGARRCWIGAKVLITEHHRIDATGGVTLADGVWIAGRGSQIWTHGLGIQEVHVERYTYIGSAVRIAPGAHIAEQSVVAMGAVVSEGRYPAYALLGGVPARVISCPYRISGWRHYETQFEGHDHALPSDVTQSAS